MVPQVLVFKLVGDQVWHSLVQSRVHLLAESHTLLAFYIITILDFDTRIARPKLPKTALPSDIREKMGLKDRRDQYRCRNDCDTNLKTLKKKSYLKKGSGKKLKEPMTANNDKKPIQMTLKNPF